MDNLAAFIALVCLILPVIGEMWVRQRGRQSAICSHPVWAVLATTALLVSVVQIAVQSGSWPMVTVRGGLQTLALVVSGGWLILRTRERMEAAGVILLALVGWLTAASLVESPGAVAQSSVSPFFSMHLGLIFLGLGAFALSFALSALFLLQRRRLKNKNLSGIQELPALDTLDRLNFRTQGFGFVALTVGIAMGFFLAMETGSGRGLDGLTFWGTVSVWCWYAIGLQTRLMGGWRGKPAAVFGVVGFGGLSLILGLAALWAGGWHGV